MFARDQIGVFALPAEAGFRGERLFHQRRGIHEHFDLRPALLRQPLRQLLQLALDHIVIIAPRRVGRDKAMRFVLQQRQ